MMDTFLENLDSSDWSGECVKKTMLNCLNGDGFFKYANMKLADTHRLCLERV